MKRNYMLCLIFAVVLCLGLANKLPPNFQRCSMSNPDFNNCLASAIDDAIRKLRNGLPELKFPPLEPMYVPAMTIGEGEGAVHVVQNYKDIRIYGTTKSNITKLDGSNIKQYRLYSESLVPYMRLEAKYNISGRILLFPIQGSGDCTISLHDVVSSNTVIGERLEKHGKTYMKVNEYLLKLHPAKVEYQFKHLFNGDERLGSEMNNLLNENWKEVFEDVKGGYEESFGLIFKDFANKLFSRIPFDDIFLE